MPPVVSVIVATYNWSAALRLALRAILKQSYRDFEVLVVGDACSDDSQAVVSACGDARVSWRNLTRNHGSQWAANNFGLHHARGEFVAYCGHDDIWHPEHLASLMRTVDLHHAGAAAAGLLMYGPSGSGAMSVAGFPPGATLRERDFVPPSGFLHRRDLIWDVGWWADADAVALPVDCDFQARVAKKAPIYATGELTVFKVVAGIRRDAYRRLDVADQQAISKALDDDPDFRLRALAQAMASLADGKLTACFMPDVEGVAPGEIARERRRFKGVEAKFDPDQLQRLTAPVRFRLDDIEPNYEWHNLETANDGSYRWSGPMTESAIDLPVAMDRPLVVELRVLSAIDPALLDTIAFEVDGRSTPHELRRPRGAETYLRLNVAPAEGHLRVTFRLARTVCAANSKDTRRLGIAVLWVDVAPVGADA